MLVQTTRMGSMVNHSDNPTAGLYRVVELPYEVHYLVTLRTSSRRRSCAPTMTRVPTIYYARKTSASATHAGPMRGLSAESDDLRWYA